MGFWNRLLGRDDEPALELGPIREQYDRGRWRGALMQLDALGESVFRKPEAFALWMQCKADLAEREGLGKRFMQLLALARTTPEQAGVAYMALSPEDKLGCGKALVEWLDARGVDGEERAETLRSLPPALWPPQRLFDAIEKAQETWQYDEFVAVARERFGDEAIASVKPRPLDAQERQRMQQAQWARSREEDAARRRASRERVRETARHNAELEAAILADQGNIEAYLVYADWLQQEGDPRGELIAVQVGRAEREDGATLEDAEQRLLGEFSDGLLGELPEAGTRAQFRFGFLDSVRLSDDAEGLSTGEQIEELCTLPDRRHLRELRIGVAVQDDENHYDDVIQMLAKRAGQLPSLRSLFIGDFDFEECEISWSALGTVSPIYKAFPELEALKLRAGAMDLGERVNMPQLKRFAIETGGLSLESLGAVRASDWPELESLELWFGDPAYGCTCELDNVLPLLNETPLPKLRHLGLRNAPFTNELIAALASSPLLAQLESLDLSLGCLTAAGAAALLANRDAFAHLRWIDLTQNCLEEEQVEELDACALVLRLENQDPDRAEDGEFYAAVGE